MKDMKERYKEDLENKDTVISDLRSELVEKNDSFEKETEKLKEMVSWFYIYCYILLLYFVAIFGFSFYMYFKLAELIRVRSDTLKSELSTRNISLLTILFFFSLLKTKHS